MSAVTYDILDAIDTRLRNDTAITAEIGADRVFRNVAPNNQSYPYIIYNLAAGVLANDTAGGLRSATYLIRCISEDAGQAARCDKLVGEAFETLLTMNDFINWRVDREEDIDLSEILDDDRIINIIGGYYNFELCDKAC